MAQGRYADAEKLQRQTLDIRRRVLGKEHPDTLSSMNNLANVLSDEAKYAEAERLLREALPTMRHVLGETHEDTLSGMNNLVAVLGLLVVGIRMRCCLLTFFSIIMIASWLVLEAPTGSRAQSGAPT